MFMAREQLASAGLPVEWHVAQGIGHGIDGEGLRLGGAFLKQAFAATARPDKGLLTCHAVNAEIGTTAASVWRNVLGLGASAFGETTQYSACAPLLNQSFKP